MDVRRTDELLSVSLASFPSSTFFRLPPPFPSSPSLHLCACDLLISRTRSSFHSHNTFLRSICHNALIQAFPLRTFRVLAHLGRMSIHLILIAQFLPRASNAFRQTPITRSPLGSSFVRGYAEGGEEKVKGAVIGIDLGSWHSDLAHQRAPG